jgi:hypothetical protein
MAQHLTFDEPKEVFLIEESRAPSRFWIFKHRRGIRSDAKMKIAPAAIARARLVLELGSEKTVTRYYYKPKEMLQ